MVAITLKDGSVRRFDGPVAGSEIARAIGPRLAKDALAIMLINKPQKMKRQHRGTEILSDSDAKIVLRNYLPNR